MTDSSLPLAFYRQCIINLCAFVTHSCVSTGLPLAAFIPIQAEIPVSKKRIANHQFFIEIRAFDKLA